VSKLQWQNIVARVILVPADIDSTIDDIAASLKNGCQAQMERHRKETFQ